MHDQETPVPAPHSLSRRTLLTRMATLALSVSALPALVKAAPATWSRDYELAVDFEINQPEGGGRYHRPYVAVWIEDANGNPVRTLSLWVQTTRRGPRWIPDLKRWYRAETARKGRDGGDLVETISSATRQPGQYTMVWNGRNDDGKPMPVGNYVVSVEAAREHGTYQILRETVSLGSKPFQKDLGGNVEIKKASVEYRKKK